MLRIALLAVCLLLLAGAAPSGANDTGETSGKQTPIFPILPPGVKIPLVVIYTLSTCPHCKEAKEYLNRNNIAFINREVDTDEEHMVTLMKIYDSMGVPEQKRGVPLFVIGNRIRIQGLNKEKLQDALKEVAATPE